VSFILNTNLRVNIASVGQKARLDRVKYSAVCTRLLVCRIEYQTELLHIRRLCAYARRLNDAYKKKLGFNTECLAAWTGDIVTKAEFIENSSQKVTCLKRKSIM
jgi:hypothetical protein